MDTARDTSARAHFSGLPFSAVISWAISSARSRIRAETWSSAAARACAGSACASRRTASAAATASSTCPAAGTQATPTTRPSHQTVGPALPYPHQSDVRGGAGLRELRPRAGRSRVRAFFGRVDDTFVVVAVGPEAQADHQGFDRAVRTGVQRLAEVQG